MELLVLQRLDVLRAQLPAPVAEEAAVEDMSRIREPGVFIVDDVAFIRAEDGDEIARQLERRGIRKEYYLETRTDVLIKNEEVFRRWRRLGLNYMFLGLEALDEEGLKAFRKKSTPAVNNEALALARSMGMSVAINIIADPDWDEPRFEFVRQWALSVPEIVNITVQHSVPWHRDLADGGPAADHPGLPAVRRPARRAADEAAAAPLLRGTGEDPVGARPASTSGWRRWPRRRGSSRGR